MTLELVVEAGLHQGLTFSTDRVGAYKIGRANDADIVLAKDKTASRQHCVIELTPYGAWVRDAGSRSGTFVNGQRITTNTRLADGDTLLVGETALRISFSRAVRLDPTIDRVASVPGFLPVKRLMNNGPGEVWWASSEHTNQMVTLHFLRMDCPDAKDRRRFLREASICSKLEHPGLVRFLDQGITEDTLWFAAELAEGDNLSQFVKKYGPLTIEQALEIMNQTLDTVAYLHQKDIVHRSLRPESLLVTRQSGNIIVRLSDLGSAKCFQELQCITSLDEPGYAIHAFTSPEALLNYQHLDPRSDIYALGAILYFALTGRTPYDVQKGQDLVMTILETDPLPLSVLRPNLPGNIVDAVGRAMARDVDIRYSTVQMMQLALFGPPVDLVRLREKLIEHFDENELRTLCFDLNVDYESLTGEGKAGKARELVAYCERHGRISELVKTCHQHRATVRW